MARLDAPRLAGLVGAVVVVAIASVVSAPTVVTNSVLASAPVSVSAPAPVSAPEPAPTLASAPALAPAPESAPAPTPESAPTPAPAPESTPKPVPASESAPAAALAPTTVPEPTPAPELPPAPTWTRLDRPRLIQVRGRHLAFDELRAQGERLEGRRADGPFSTKVPTVLVHYASWCTPCVDELPEVVALARTFADISIFKKIRPRLVFVSHDEARGPEALLASFEDLLAKAKLGLQDLPPHLGLRADPDGHFAAALTRARIPVSDPSALPATWLLDRKGRLLAHLEGPLTDHERLLTDLGGSQ